MLLFCGYLPSSQASSLGFGDVPVCCLPFYLPDPSQSEKKDQPASLSSSVLSLGEVRGSVFGSALLTSVSPCSARPAPQPPAVSLR